MLVMVLESVPVGLRGELTRWLIEPHPSVFVGHVSALVRDRLWQKCCQDLKGGGVMQVWSTNNEQRLQMRTFGAMRREVVDFEGLQLIRLPAESEAQTSSQAKAQRGRRPSQTATPKGY